MGPKVSPVELGEPKVSSLLRFRMGTRQYPLCAPCAPGPPSRSHEAVQTIFLRGETGLKWALRSAWPLLDKKCICSYPLIPFLELELHVSSLKAGSGLVSLSRRKKVLRHEVLRSVPGFL